MFTEEQEREMQFRMLWNEAHNMTDEQLIWLSEAYPEFVEIKDYVIDMKKFKTAFNS